MSIDIIITIILSSLSILLILTEIFLLPGITFAGIAGAIFSAGSIYYAYSHLGTLGGNITVAASVITLGVLFIWLVRSRTIDKISLNTDIDSKVETDHLDQIKEGDEGIAISRLNPVGKVKINNVFAEAKALTGFIDDGATVIVVKKLSNQVLVKIKS